MERGVFAFRKPQRLRPVLENYSDSSIKGLVAAVLIVRVDLAVAVGVVGAFIRGGRENLHILEFLVDLRLVVLVNGNNLDNIALLELSGKSVRKRLHSD